MSDMDAEASLEAQRLYKHDKRAPVLRTFTIVTGLVHLGSGIATIVLHVDKKVPLNEPYLGWPSRKEMDDPALNRFTLGTHPAGQVSFLAMVSAFFFLSAGFQIIPALVPQLWEPLLELLLERNIQPFRWLEYSISASLMFMIAAILNGTFDAQKIAYVFVLSFVMMMLGLGSEMSTYFQRQLEFLSNGKLKRNVTDYFFLHVLGWVPFGTLWGIQMRQFQLNINHSSSHPPSWVYVLYSTQIIIMALFGGNQLWQHVDLYRTRAGDSARQARIALRTEYVYVTLSLTAKSVLAWVLYSGFRAQQSTKYA